MVASGPRLQNVYRDQWSHEQDCIPYRIIPTVYLDPAISWNPAPYRGSYRASRTQHVQLRQTILSMGQSVWHMETVPSIRDAKL